MRTTFLLMSHIRKCRCHLLMIGLKKMLLNELVAILCILCYFNNSESIELHLITHPQERYNEAVVESSQLDYETAKNFRKAISGMARRQGDDYTANMKEILSDLLSKMNDIDRRNAPLMAAGIEKGWYVFHKCRNCEVRASVL